jgi:sulfoacetaldehyde dehydrogenase
VHVVDETADVADAAAAILMAKTFDYATSCLADNAVVAHADIYDDLVRRLTESGAHRCDQQQKDALRAVMWPDGGAVPAIAVVAKSAAHIADLAGFAVDPGCPMLVVEETGAGPDHPFSGEKLSVVLAIYRYEGGISAAADLVNAITAYQGLGHTCGIHTSSEANVGQLAMTTRTARVLVNQNLNEGAGSPRNGLPFTLSLSCGTWGGTITTENINARHFVNLTWVSEPITPRNLDPDVLFARHFQHHGR